LDDVGSLDASQDGQLSPDINDDSTVRLEEHIEVISTDDARIKIIGEELANETGRAIFTKICQASTSPIELAKSLGISLPLVNWHLNRMMGIGLIRIDKIGMSSKNKGMKYYAPTKTVLVIIPPRDRFDSVRLGHVEKLIDRVTKHMTAIVCFVIGTAAFFLIGTMLTANSGGIQLSDPDFVIPTEWQMLSMSFLAGIATAISSEIAVRIVKWFRRKKSR
jgi:DNA-binding transcriptional ArsR family regulator